MQREIPYELAVDIDKDYSDFKRDIECISKMIDHEENYEETIQKVCKKNQ